MLNLMVDEYKFQLFLFEKMGSRSIEDAINNLVGNHEWEGITRRYFGDNEYHPGGMSQENGIFNYKQYDGRIQEDYLDLDSRPYETVWPKDYKRILIYRNTYHRLVSSFYNALNARGKDKEGWSDEYGRGAWDVFYEEEGVIPTSDDLETHIDCFHNFCNIHFYNELTHWVDGVFYGKLGHMSAIWEQIPRFLIKEVDYIISLDEVNNNKLIDILEKQGVPNQLLEELTKSLYKNKEFYSKQKSKMGTTNQHLRSTNNYNEYYDTMDEKIFNAITEFYKDDLELTGIKSP